MKKRGFAFTVNHMATLLIVGFLLAFLIYFVVQTAYHSRAMTLG